jgi:hypothetical protein
MASGVAVSLALVPAIVALELNLWHQLLVKVRWSSSVIDKLAKVGKLHPALLASKRQQPRVLLARVGSEQVRKVAVDQTIATLEVVSSAELVEEHVGDEVFGAVVLGEAKVALERVRAGVEVLDVCDEAGDGQEVPVADATRGLQPVFTAEDLGLGVFDEVKAAFAVVLLLQFFLGVNAQQLLNLTS